MSSSEGLSLPFDIYPLIARAVSDKRTLYNLCLTSKSVCKATQACLYRNYRQGFRRGNLLDPAPIRPFLRTLVSRPDLGRLVRKVSLRMIWAEEESHGHCEEWKRNQDARLDELKRQCWAEHGSDKRGIIGVEVAAVKELLLLLHLTPNVRGLVMDTSLMSSTYFGPLMSRFLAWMPQEPERGRLEKLTTLVLDNSGKRKCGMSNSLLDYQELLGMPLLRTLICFGLDMKPRTDSQLTNMQSIQNFYFQDFLFDTNQFRSFCSQCTGLKSMRAEINPIISTADFYMGHTVHPIQEALETHVDSLESLALRFVESCRGSNEVLRDDLDFHSFGKLSSLDITWAAIRPSAGTSLFGNLPPSLRYLVLRGCQPKTLSHLQECFAKGQRPPQLLRAITIVACGDWDLNTKVAEQIELEAAASKAGIALSLIRITDESPDHYPVIEPQWRVAPEPIFMVDIDVG